VSVVRWVACGFPCAGAETKSEAKVNSNVDELAIELEEVFAAMFYQEIGETYEKAAPEASTYDRLNEIKLTIESLL
jgi:hypothetical protein